jgi:hypothetical protein
MNPVAVVLGLIARGIPWAVIGSAGAMVGSIAVRGARAADVPPVIPGLEVEREEGGAPEAARVITIGPGELAAGALGGPALALLLRPRPLGAFLGGLVSGAAVAALLPGAGPWSGVSGDGGGRPAGEESR